VSALYRSILVPVDGSRDARAALDHAIAVARDQRARLTLVSVVPRLPANAALAGACAEDLRESYARVLAEHRDIVPDDVSLTTRLLEGSPARQIAACAEDHDVVIMGTHGRGRFGEALLGSISREVVHESTVPVLLIRAPRRVTASAA
jgi:nucleotide-binding universal stress UspA family protein